MKNILIIKTGALGDVLRTTVILEGLIDKYVAVRIHWLTSEKAIPLLDMNPFIDKLYVIENLEKSLFEQKYDLVISLEEKKEILILLENINKKEIFGIYLKNKEITYTESSSAWFDMSLVSKFGKIVADQLKKSNIMSYPEMIYKLLDLHWTTQRYRLFITKKEIEYANTLKEKIPKNNIIIGIGIGAGDTWPMKVMSDEKLIDLINAIKNEYGENVTIVSLTGTNTLELNRNNKLKETNLPIINNNVTNLNELIGTIKICDLIISPDSLTMHIGIALGKTTISYFTVTSASEIEIYTGKKILSTHEDFCSYITTFKEKPNITDSVNIKKILEEVKKHIKL
ncbi:MAG: glycosyltransferase family 9 protein [Candidatus Woesearchaeota archaeon]|jgi:heptosyltransferase-2